MDFLIGADPELFLMNPNSKQFISAEGLIPGTKYEPYKVPYGAVQVDGMAAEFNIDPATNVDEFLRNINNVRKQLQDMLPGYNLEASPTADFSDEVFAGASVEAKQLGCDPDFCAWTGKQNTSPDGAVQFRTGSGHIHVGWTSDVDIRSRNHFADCVLMAKQLDHALGVPSLLWDPDCRRRNLYGKAGAFRPKPYGMEYRTLSNAWLQHENLTRWVYDATLRAAQDLANGVKYNDHSPVAREIIDNNVVNWLELGNFKPVWELPKW